MRRLPLDVQTLYAELVEQLSILEARRSIGHLSGSFVTKEVKGQRYCYFQHSAPGGGVRQIYLGRCSAQFDKVVALFERGREALRADRTNTQRLCSLLRVGGAMATDTAAARVLRALAESAVFHLGGVLVGTHAFLVLGNVLGVRWGGGAVRTDDVDIAGERTLAVTVPDLQADVPSALESLQMGFFPVPALSHRDPSTSFKVRGRPLRIDLLTPQRGSATKPIQITRFKAAAKPLKYLDYLIEDAQPAAVIDGEGVLVQVPAPGRFAFHKLLVSRLRPAAMQSKSEKDLWQASQIISFSGEDRPGDLALAWEALVRRGAGGVRALRAALIPLKKRHPESYEGLLSAVSALRK